jgi:hypothetical protein
MPLEYMNHLARIKATEVDTEQAKQLAEKALRIYSNYPAHVAVRAQSQLLRSLAIHVIELSSQINETKQSFTTSDKELELSDWLNSIAADIISGHCQDNVIAHLQKHVHEPLGEGEPCKNLKEWMASLVNLVEIAKRVFGIYPDVEDQLERLQRKFEKEGVENGYTPNPRSAIKTDEQENKQNRKQTDH